MGENGIVVSDENIVLLKDVEYSWLKQKEDNEISCAQVLKDSLNDTHKPLCQNEDALNKLKEIDDGTFEDIFSRVKDEADTKYRLNLEEEIIGIKLKIKKLELEPEIIYSKGFASGRGYRVLSSEQKIQEEIAELVRQKDKQETDKTIADLRKNLDKKLSDYDKKYEGDSLIIKVWKKTIRQQVPTIEIENKYELDNNTEEASNIANLRPRW